MNHDILNREKPIMPMPNSSGKGEAIISPPMRNVNHRKYFILSRTLNLLPIPRCCTNSIKCTDNLSRTNRKMMRSPITAPIAPKMATKTTEFDWAISPKVTMAGAAVNTEVKNMPAMKLPSISSSLVEVSILPRTSVRTKTTARAMLITTMLISLSRKLFLLVFIVDYYTPAVWFDVGTARLL